MLEKNHFDLDIIIAAKDLMIIERSLYAGRNWKLVQMFQQETSCYNFILAVQGEDSLTYVHLNTRVDYRRDGRLYFTARELLAGRQLWNGFWLAAAEVEFDILLVQGVFDDVFADDKTDRLKELRRQLGHRANHRTKRLFGKHWGVQSVEWMDNSDWASWRTHRPVLKSALGRQALQSNPLDALKVRLAGIRGLCRRGYTPNGMYVAVLGSDGSGKSTLIQNLQRTLAGAFFQTVVFHFRPHFLGRKTDDGPENDPHGRPPRSLWSSMLKIIYYILDYNLSYPFGTRLPLARGTLVIFDRYYDDLLVDPRRYRYGGPMRFVSLGRKVIPQPDLFLILDLPARQILARKQEVSLPELRRQRERYRKLATELPTAILLDGSLPVEAVACRAAEALLDDLHQRYAKRRRRWFRDRGDGVFHRFLAAFDVSSKKLS